MDVFHCSQDTLGYSGAIPCFSAAKLHAHRDDGKDAEGFYQEIVSACESVVWIYMPMDKGEFIQQVWAVRSIHGVYMALMLLSNRGRAALFGTYFKAQLVQFCRIFAASTGPSRIYFNARDMARTGGGAEIEVLGFEEEAFDDAVQTDDEASRGYPPRWFQPRQHPTPSTMSRGTSHGALCKVLPR